MMPAATKNAGISMAIPDTCKTPAPPAPPVPIPYPNIALMPAATGAIDKVLIENKETIVESTKIPSSSGDEAGVAGGVVSGVNMSQAAPKTFSSKVYVKGKKVVMLGAVMGHNGSNANMPLGAHIVPSQVKVFVAQ
jgi:hypothetical protein